MTLDCAGAREQMLEADPAELRGFGDTPLAAHLRGCAACRARADAILAGQAELGAALDVLAAPRPAEGTRVIPLRRRSTLRRVAAIAIPLAAAASAAGILLRGRDGDAPPPGVQTERIARALFPRQPRARPEPGSRAAVLATNDPRVTVIWIY